MCSSDLKKCKSTNTWRLNTLLNTWRLNTLLNNQEITEEIKEEIKKYLETNDNENTTIQNLWDAAKPVLRGKFIAIQSYFKKQKISNKQSKLTPKGTGERRTNKIQS